MPRLPVRHVSLAELQALFGEMTLWSQIEDGTLSTIVVSSRPATNPHYAGGTSQMLIHRDITDRQVCTTHRILAADGVTVLHWDESDVKLDTETVAKVQQQGSA